MRRKSRITMWFSWKGVSCLEILNQKSLHWIVFDKLISEDEIKSQKLLKSQYLYSKILPSNDIQSRQSFHKTSNRMSKEPQHIKRDHPKSLFIFNLITSNDHEHFPIKSIIFRILLQVIKSNQNRRAKKLCTHKK